MTPAEKAELALKLIETSPIIAYDTETTGLDWKRNNPIGYVITDNEHSLYIPIRHGGGGNLPSSEPFSFDSDDPEAEIIIHSFEKALARAFEIRNKKGYTTVGHHLKFDCHFSANAGVMLGRNLSCTQNNEALINEQSKGFSLEFLSNKYGVEAKLAQPMYDHLANLFGGKADKNQMAHYWRAAGNDPMAVEYAEGDGVSTLQVYNKQLEIIQEEELGRIWGVENELIWTLFRMERRGVAIDTQYLQSLKEEIEQILEDSLKALPDNFNPRSPTMMKEYLTSHGHTDWPLTEKGNPSFTEKYLKTIDAGTPIINLRKWSNLLNSFVQPLIDTHVYNGRVHANVNQNKADEHGTISGRTSMSSPNMQQIPKHNKELAKKFRPVFVADEGMVFWECDYSQCEPRLFTHYSGDERLIEGYNADPPRDMHQLVAEMFNVDRGTKAKRMNMGILTGMFPKSFAGHMDLPLSEATDLWNKWFELFPKVKNFQDLAKNVMLSRGHVKTLLGRRGRLESRRFAYKAVSKIIQGGNADILKYKLLETDKMLEKEGDKAHMLITVHDSFVFQTPEGPEGDAIAEKIMNIMTNVKGEPFNLSVPFTVDAGKGKNWKEASFPDG